MYKYKIYYKLKNNSWQGDYESFLTLEQARKNFEYKKKNGNYSLAILYDENGKAVDKFIR